MANHIDNAVLLAYDKYSVSNKIKILLAFVVVFLIGGMVYFIVKQSPQKTSNDSPTVTFEGKKYTADFLKNKLEPSVSVPSYSEALTVMEKKVVNGQKLNLQDYLDLGYLYRVNNQNENAIKAYNKAITLLDKSDPTYITDLEYINKSIEDTKTSL